MYKEPLFIYSFIIFVGKNIENPIYIYVYGVIFIYS
nr:MAG TPA: hypothetical protein [Caudoviricetes sp.]